ncbi:MAG: TetR/AcrR family transcriptional regulator [Bacteroidota bacterium]
MEKTLKHEIKADFLLERGMEILWSKGYNATSVNDIVGAAGVPKGSFYFYFESKEDFVIKAIEMYFDAQFTPASEFLNNKKVSPKQRILDFYAYRAKILKEELECKKGCLACNIGNEMAEHNENIRRVIVENEKIVHEQIASAVKEAQEAGEIDAAWNAMDVVAFFEDAGKGAMTSMKELQSSYPIDNYMHMVRTMLFK